MHNVEDILKTFETAQITDSKNILDNEFYSKTIANKTKKTNSHESFRSPKRIC